MCCGQKRALLTTHPSPLPETVPIPRRNAPASVPARPNAPAPRATTASPISAGPAQSPVRLQYKEHSPIQVRGLATGRVYRFSGSQPLQEVDERDAASLLQTPFFRRI